MHWQEILDMLGEAVDDLCGWTAAPYSPASQV